MFQFVEKPCGTPLHVAVSDWETRPGAGCIVFLPGYHSTFNSRMFKTLATWSQENRLNFISLEYSAHGKSPGDMQKVTMHDFFKESQYVIDRFYKPEMGPQTLTGHSIGGVYVSTMVMPGIRNPNHDITGALSIAATIGLTAPTQGYVYKLFEKPDVVEHYKANDFIWSPLGEATKMFYTRPFVESARDFDLLVETKRDETGNMSWHPHPKVFSPNLVPQVFINGLDDEAAPVEHVHQFTARFPKDVVRLVTMKAEPHPRRPSDIQLALHGMSRAVDLDKILEETAALAFSRQPSIVRQPAPAQELRAG